MRRVRAFVLVIACALFATAPADAQLGFSEQLLSSQVAAVSNGTTTRATSSQLGQSYSTIEILINITGGGTATGTLQLFVEDSVDGGTTWDDLVSSNTFTFGAATTTQRFFISGSAIPSTIAGAVATNLTQGSAVSVEAMAAGTARQGPIGERTRIREKVSGISGSPVGPTYTVTAVFR